MNVTNFPLVSYFETVVFIVVVVIACFAVGYLVESKKYDQINKYESFLALSNRVAELESRVFVLEQTVCE